MQKVDEKKVKEAIEFLQRKIHTLDAQKEYDEYCNPVHNETLDLAIGLYETAIKALEKQLPKKVENWNGQASCPRCKRLFGNMADIEMFCYWDSDCCNHCGQRLDWSE